VPNKKKYFFSTIICLLFFVCLPGLSQSNFSIAKKEGFYGVSNSNGKFIIPAKYKDVQEPVTSIYAVKDEKGLWGFFSGSTKISECQFDNFRFTPNNLIIVQKFSRWGVINTKGETLLDFRYKYINHVTGNTFKAGQFNQWCIRDFKNQKIATFEFDSLEYLGENVYKFCLANKYGLIDQNGKVITTEFQNIFESTLRNKYPKKEFAKPTPILAKGDFRIPLEERFDTVYHFSEGFAKFQSGNKFGFVDSLGNIRLVPQYTNTRHFSEGMVAVVLVDKWGFMDKNEKLCVQPYYDDVSDFKNGVAVVRKGKKYNILNKQGIFLYSEDFDNIIPAYSGKYLLLRNNKMGLANASGHELVSTKYEEVDELGNSFIVAREHGLWGILNEKGDIVLPFNYTVIQFDPEHNRLITMEPGRELVISY
jgi:hypothetical protein